MRVNTTIDNVSPSITYSSGWSDSKTSDPMWTEYYLSTYIMCSRAGANATFTFNGTGVWLYGALRKDHGLYNVTIDGVTTTYDGFGAGDGLYQQPLFAAANLSPGIHSVTLTNNRNSSTYSNLDLDFIIWEEELGGQNDTVNNQTEDDNASGFEYGPAATAWNTVPENVVQYHGGTGHTTVSSTAYVTYTFTGDAVSIFGALGPSQGPYSVQLDGNAPANYTGVASGFFAQQLLYHATGLGGGQHSVRLTNMPAKTGDSLSIDYAIANAIQVPLPTTSSTSATSTSSSTSTTSTSETAAATSDTSSTSSKGLPTGGIVAIVVGGLALMAIISFALMMWRRKKQDQKDKDDPDMIVVYPEPYSVGHDSYGGGPGRYIPPSQYMSGGYNPLESGGSNPSPIYPPNRNVYNQPGGARGDYFPPGGQQQPDGASLFSGYAPGPPRMPGQEPGRPRVDSSSTAQGHPLSEVATTAPYGGSSAYTANSNGSSRLPDHGHSVLNVSDHPLPPLPANNQSLALHTAPPLPAGRIPPRKGQVTLPPSAAPDQQQEFRGMSEEELRRRRLNVEGREQDFGPLLMDDVLPSQPGVPLPPDYTQATEVLRR